eukprot:2300369-Amphidinium_carterae.1
MKGEWIRMDMTVDSGCSVSCLPKKVLEYMSICKLGSDRKFQSASGHVIEDLGDVLTMCSFQNGVTKKC